MSKIPIITSYDYPQKKNSNVKNYLKNIFKIDCNMNYSPNNEK